MAIENFYEEEAEQVIEIDLNDLSEEFDWNDSLIVTPTILVVREDYSRRFSGVRSCGKNSTHQRQAQHCLEDFLKDVLYDHRHLRYMDSKIESISARWRNRVSWDGKRSCSGRVTATCVARFSRD